MKEKNEASLLARPDKKDAYFFILVTILAIMERTT